ncbi:MAG: TldD/PmbA family protein [Candidatus Marinimicrobia bacterium]|jgi:predicted Zn-dependent protease|nr:TldD/PmbA family protein [Candidatus Neomarinimicrobiota bacterium]MBT3617842.1 TldD/PmbA family protein [Candidatus Neomarinimicrobiota bacterium]MBT3828199.1 TldD/PmbA family protein [Candidatus Neomarinimicrobiota bacterium]MBT3997116.1 TldD/PmbA family protein [Candidatus Neomarinimicrobiota bacterium]MBT4280582.1 TldD/PmbA family protein [Candidatus Neomarinimicrobiota bacterium]
MTRKEIDLNQLLNEVQVSADWIGLREVYEKVTPRMIRDGVPVANGSYATHGVMVEVLIEGQFGYYGTSDITAEGISDAAKNAYTQAKLASKFGLVSFTEEVRPAYQGKYQSPFAKNSDAISPGQLNEMLLNMNSALKVSDKIVSASSLVQVIETHFKFVSTNGSDITQNFLLLETDMSATASEGTNQQTRTFGGMRGNCKQIGFEYFDSLDLVSRAVQIGEEAIELLDAVECPTGEMDIILAPDQMMLQIHESVGHALEIDRILGDERNFAGWSFVKLEDFGNLQYGSNLMNITFDPTVSGEFASYGFDDGGLKAEREFIIKDGTLLRGLGGMESQIRSGIKGVANFRASNWNRSPIDRMANLNLEPGDATRDEIIASVEKGVYMESNRSWSIDDYRNKFQFGCEYGKLIENGKLTKTIKNPNYRGISNPFWNSLKMVGNKDTFGIYGTPNCGKGEPSQIIRVGHASPLCLFENIQVFGGA